MFPVKGAACRCLRDVSSGPWEWPSRTQSIWFQISGMLFTFCVPLGRLFRASFLACNVMIMKKNWCACCSFSAVPAASRGPTYCPRSTTSTITDLFITTVPLLHLLLQPLLPLTALPWFILVSQSQFLPWPLPFPLIPHWSTVTPIVCPTNALWGDLCLGHNRVGWLQPGLKGCTGSYNSHGWLKEPELHLRYP